MGFYFDRKGDDALCEPCGAMRWGDPHVDDRGSFDRRLDDTSGEWCWTNVLAGGSACATCGQVIP